MSKTETNHDKQNTSAPEKNSGKIKKKRTLLQRVVNVFLYTGVGLLFLLLVFLGISQTSTFREFVRGKIIDIANESLNGTLYIEKLEGTIFTSVILHNTVVNMGDDTLFKSEKISIKISPLQLFLKKIYVRDIEINNTVINISTDSAAVLNISKLFPPSEEEDTTASEFPFKIEVAGLALKNLDFSFQTFDKTGSMEIYEELNTDDIRIKNLNIALSAEANINQNDYKLVLHHLSLEPNVSKFNLKEFSGIFLIDENNVLVKNLQLKTNESKVAVNLELNDLNIFDSEGIDVNNAYINLTAVSETFSFDDIKGFVPGTEILNGSTAFRIKADGYLAELNVSQVLVQFPNSKIEGSGKLLSLNKPESMFMNFDLSNSYVDQNDISSLLPGLKIPTYPEYGIIRFDSLKYSGEPLLFESTVNISTDKGSLAGMMKFNLKKELPEYDISLRTGNLDLSPFTGAHTGLNLSAVIKGKGTSPNNLDMNLDVAADGSTYNGSVIDTLNISAEAKNKNISYSLNLFSDITYANISGNFDFTSEENPAYEVKGDVRNFNVEKLTNDTSLKTNLNLSLEAEGENFDPDKMNLFLTMNLFESSVADTKIDGIRAIVDLRRSNGNERVINIISDLADVTINGDFTVAGLVDLLGSEAELISVSLKEKISSLMPSLIQDEEIKAAGLKIKKPLFQYSDKSVDLNYVIELKDFSFLSAFLGNIKFEVDGELGGVIKSQSDNIFLSFNSKLNYIRYYEEDDIYFIQNFVIKTDISNSFKAASTSDIGFNILVSSEKVYAGREIYNFNFAFNMLNDVAAIKADAESLPFIAAINGEIDITGNLLAVNLDKIKLSYNQFILENKKRIGIILNEGKIEINDFNLMNNNSLLAANGFLSEFRNDFNLQLKNFSGKDLSEYVLNMKPENSIDANINLTAHVTGNIADPEILFEMSVDNISFMERNFGSLQSIMTYNDKNLDIDIKFLDSLFNPTKPALMLTGNYPLDLSFGSDEKENISTGQVNIHLKSEGFNLGAFGDVLPAVNKLRGILTSDLRITGTLSDIYPSGYLKVNDAAFILEANNLEYNTALDVKVEGNNLTVENIVIANADGTQYGGRMTGKGNAVLDGFDIISSKFSVNGDLKVLSEESKSAMPSLYGDLVIATKGNLEIEKENERIFLKAPIIVKRAKLTLPQTQSVYKGGDNYIYKFVETDTVVTKEIDFETEVKLARLQESKTTPAKAGIFDVLVDVEIEDEITVIIVLSREFNQNLTAVLKGDLKYSRFGGRTDVQGKLDLLEGSTLEFIKTLAAQGSIRFEGDITNPFLDIVATYKDYYLPLTGSDAGKEIEVAVKLNLEGTLKNLNKKLVQTERNFKVYYGAENIENNQPALQYDASDAAMFILLGKFNNDADQQDKNAVASYATGLAGSLVGGFLNNQFGDVIKGVELRQVGSTTVVNIIGRVGKFRYEVGTSASGYQDISRTNVKIEYPVTRRFFLNLKRKEPVSTESSYIGEMINEFGLKYLFEF